MTSTGSVSKRAANLQGLVLTALFAAILLLMGFTPLGLIDLPFMRATTLHIPVIIASVLLGPGRGGFLGGMFGLISLWKGTMAPNLVSFAFSPFVPLPGETHGTPWALVICFVPRILVGVVPWFVVKLFERIPGNRTALKTVGYAFAGAVGSAVNTVLVMGLIALLLGDAYAAAQGIGRDLVNGFILTTVFANGIPEAIAAAVIVPPVCLGLSKALSTIQIKRGPGK
ncbi:ECF transporter S component [Acutalibacter sp. 1XD8-33]|uniref:ECF transporter S component n=1 Tax=Acutalibacter sp. 1XD8-33 TaxID=2320081 RepID=UPI000EA28552|nr:ECF transporter S component [Acutalibacter sp. 1XD8-33]RKJ42250.1 ECF transporter S component [Acutalibacter sp. 1XD8-33]